MFIALTFIAHLHSKFRLLDRRGNEVIGKTRTQAEITTTTTTVRQDLRKGILLSQNLKPMADTEMATQSAVDTNNCTGDETQVINFTTCDKQYCHSVCAEYVTVMASAGKHGHGSSKVKLKNFVDYKWEEKHYPGHLIAVHRDGKYIAYAINVNNKATRMEGMVRVVNASAGLRALIKGMSGEVLDLQFANIAKHHILASIDLNSLYVHKIDLIDGTLIWNLVLKIEDPIANYSPKFDRISWCPFISTTDDEEDLGEEEDESQLVVWARGKIFQCFDVKGIVAKFGSGIMQTSALKSGYIKFSEELLITWVALSPDGTTLAAASGDGVVRFYQVYMFDDQNHRCLHQWKPHDGKMITSLFFLDNINRNLVDTYWKYAITGADNNTEFKVWDCSLWQCLQTIKINTDNVYQKTPRFIAEIDRSASYLVVTSLEIRAAYILQIQNNVITTLKDPLKSVDGGVAVGRSATVIICGANGRGSSDSTMQNTPASRSNEVQPVSICSIAEFPLSSGILSFSIVDTAVRRLKSSNDSYIGEELDDYDDEPNNSKYSVVVHMFVVQSKSMQECHILYQPVLNEKTNAQNSISLLPNKSTGRIESICSQDSIHDEDKENEELLNVNEIKTEKINRGSTTLNMIFAAAADSKTRMCRPAATTSSAVVAVAAAAAAAPSAVAQEPAIKSRSTTPKSGKVAYLMTPDAFSAKVPNVGAIGNDKNTPDNVSSEVLNTIRMLATVAGPTANNSKTENINLIHLVNNKLIEETHKSFVAIDSDPGRNAANATETQGSGGSSPSREVQEIMSIQDDKFLDELCEFINELPISPLLEDSYADLGEPEVEEQAAATNSQTTTNNICWPKAPEIPQSKEQSKHSAELQNAANIMSQAVNATNNNVSLPLGNIGSGVCNNNTNSVHDSSTVELIDLNAKITQLIDLVQMQSKQLHSLQCEVIELKKANPLASNKNFSEFSFKLEMQLSKLMEQYLKRFENEHKKKLNAFMQGREVQNREIRDSFVQIINQYVINQFSEVVVKVISIELQRQLVPMFAAKMDHMQQQVQLDVAQKLTTFDMMLKENIAQVCKSKHFIDAFGKSVLVGVQNSLQAAFIESMGSTLIPAYEKSSQLMFKQLHDAFTVGIKDFLVQFDSYLQHLKPMQDSSEQMVNKFGAFRQHLETALAKHINVVSEAMHETQKEVKSLEILLGRQVQETIRVELRKSFENQSVALRSQANTPAPTYDLKQTIKHLLLQGQLNKAFHQALLANDLSLVEYTLKNTDITNVFTPKCCLEQKVLLSLIQQLSADMSNHNETKQNYLSEALLAINPDDPIAREHAPKVLQDLYRSYQQFLKSYPKSPHCSNVRMTMKAVHSYINQF